MLSAVWFVTHTIQRYGRRGQAPVPLSTASIQKQQAAKLQQDAERERNEQEIQRQQQEQLKKTQEEELKKIQEQREAELKFQKEAEEAAQRKLEEELKLKQEAEAEALRQKEEELKRQQEAEAEKKRIEEEAEKKRIEEEAEKKRLEEEAEKKRLEEEAEKKRLEEEAEKKRIEEEAEKKRLAEEAEKKRQEEEAEKKRQEEAEAERKRQEEAEAEKKREEEAAAAKKADEEKVASSESSPLTTSTKTITLTPSVSGNKMSEQWAQQQVEKFSFTFDQADVDKNGSLSFIEVFNVIKSAGFRGSEQEAKFIFGHLDRNHDDKISKFEFTAAMNNLPRVNLKVFVLRKAFLTLDKDNSGFLTRQEILDATSRDCGLDIAAEKISDLLVYLVKEDDDNKISFEEFLHVFGIEHVGNTMEQIFAKLDTDKSGFLTRDEILAATRKENELSMYREQISNVLLAWVKDTPSNKINYQDFVNIWKQQRSQKK